MQDAVQTRQLIRFGIFEADLETGELRRNGRKLRLAGQPFDVLAVLLEHPGRIVTRDELQKRLWPDTVVEVEHSLNTAINKIREALDDLAENPRFIETLPRRGYRFIAPVFGPPQAAPSCPDPAPATETATVAPSIKQAAAASSEKQTRRWIVFGTAVAILGISGSIIWYLRAPLPPPRITDYVQLTNDGRARTIGGTDGTRLFVNAFGPEELAVVSISDGRSSPFRIDVPSAKQCGSTLPIVRDVSNDGSWLLVLCSVGLFENQVWIVGSLGSPARLLINAQDAAWSADGKSVVYSTPEGAIYRISSAGGQPDRLIPAIVANGKVKMVRSLAWSPDGEVIRFTRDHAIWEVSSSGGTPHQLLLPQEWKLPSCCGRWTQDGNFFIFIYGETLFHTALSQSAAQIWAIDERKESFHRPNTKPTKLIAGPIRWADPVPSPDGSRIFARGVSVRGDLARYDMRLKQFQPYLPGTSSSELAFSRDGKYVAYVSFPDGALWKADVDGSNVVQLTQPSSDHAAAPSFSPDGNQIIYEAATSSEQNAVMVVPSHGGSPRPLLAEPNGFYNDANWSPDGKHIVFASIPLGGDVPLDIREVRIKIFDSENHRISVLPDSNATFSPRWSPDGRYIAALGIPNAEMRVYDLTTRRWLPLVHKPLTNYPSWSRDSRHVYGLSFGEKTGVYRIPINGGPAELVVDLTSVRQTGWWGFWFGLDPTDAPLILRDAGAYEIYSLTLEH